MLAKISELMQCKSFTVKELTGVTITPEGRTGGKVISEYKFQYDSDIDALHVSGDVFGDELHMV